MEENVDEPEDVRLATPVEDEIKKADEPEEPTQENEKLPKKKIKNDAKKREVKLTTLQKGGEEEDCCTNKKRMIKDRKAKWGTIYIFDKECQLLKPNTIPRNCLSKKEHLNMLATPSRKCEPQWLKKPVTRKLKPISPRIEELARPPIKRILRTIEDRGDTIAPELLDNLINMAEAVASLNPEQAAQLFHDKKSRSTKKCMKKKGKIKCRSKKDKEKRKEDGDYPRFDPEAVCCQYLMAERFVKSILEWKRPIQREEYQDIANVILRRLGSIIEYTPIDNGDRKSQQMRFLADVISCWISGVLLEVAEDNKKELEEECVKRKHVDEEETEEEEEESEEETEHTLSLNSVEESEDDKEDKDKDNNKEDEGDQKKKSEKECAAQTEEQNVIEEGEAEEEVMSDNEKADEEETKRKNAEEEEAESQTVEEEVARNEILEETELATKRAEEEELARKQVEEEAEIKRLEEEEVEKTQLEEAEIERKRAEEEEAEVKRIEEAENARLEEEQAEKKKVEEEAEKTRIEEEAEKIRLEEEAENKRAEEEVEKTRLEEEAEKIRLEEEDENIRAEEEAEKTRIKEEAEKIRLEEEDENIRAEEEAEKIRAEEARNIRIEEKVEKQKLEEAAEKKNEKEEEAKSKRIEALEEGNVQEVDQSPPTEDIDLTKLVGEKPIPETKEFIPIETGPSNKVYQSDLPFVTFIKICNTLYSMIENEKENTGQDPVINRLHRSVYEMFHNAVLTETPTLLTDNAKDMIDVMAGKIATWLSKVLTESQILLLEKYPPEVESKEVRDWSNWIDHTTETAGNWSLWLQKLIEEVKKMQDNTVTRGQWEDFTQNLNKNALLWRRFHLDTVHKAHHNVIMLKDRKVVKTGEKKTPDYPERELNVFNLKL